MVTLHGTMEYGAMVLHDIENCTKIMASYDHVALAQGFMQCNHNTQW
jgi:hypothetical protein